MTEIGSANARGGTPRKGYGFRRLYLIKLIMISHTERLIRGF